MRLLNAKTLRFEVFNENALPRYVILSHTWGDDEVTYQDMLWLEKWRSAPDQWKKEPMFEYLLSEGESSTPRSEKELLERSGYKKIVATAWLTVGCSLEYCWVDTCCIDKRSSAELQEAINSMYRWYQESALCLVHLAGVRKSDSENVPFKHLLSGSRWITRGWTLQEMIAPSEVRFYYDGWEFLATKRKSGHALSEATGVPLGVLRSGDLSVYSVAQKLSWAAYRSTSRVEDRAYSLMGLFDIHMPMLYGEGEKAFGRLQEEIMKRTGDDSLFAWQDFTGETGLYRGLFARSPREFAKCGSISSGPPREMAVTNVGLRLRVNYRRHPSKFGCYIVTLGARRLSQRVSILLREVYTEEESTTATGFEMRSEYARIDAHLRTLADPTSDLGCEKNIYVRDPPYIPPSFAPEDAHSFHLQPSQRSRVDGYVRLLQVWPPKSWHSSSYDIHIPSERSNFLSVVGLEYFPNSTSNSGPTRFCFILGFAHPGRGSRQFRPWITVEKQEDRTEKLDLEQTFRRFLRADIHGFGTKTVFPIRTLRHSEDINIKIESALRNGRMSFLTKIDGFKVSMDATRVVDDLNNQRIERIIERSSVG